MPGADYSKAIDEAQRLADNYVVGLADDGEVLGSGTLVNVAGVNGILTANHVVKLSILEKRRTEFVLCYRRGIKHTHVVAMDQFLHIVVGPYREQANEELGPDLSLLVITDSTLYEALAKSKSFYSLDEQYDASPFPSDKLTQMPWSISGCPDELRINSTTEGGETLTKLSNIHVPAHLLSIDERGGFDYLSLQVDAGRNDAPEKYGGVSGGGIWLVSGMHRESGAAWIPLLQGVCFYATAAEHQKSILTGHGPKSLYRRVRDQIIGST